MHPVERGGVGCPGYKVSHPVVSHQSRGFSNRLRSIVPESVAEWATAKGNAYIYGDVEAY